MTDGMFNGRAPDSVLEGGPDPAQSNLQPDHVLAVGARALLSDVTVTLTHQRLYQATIQGAIYHREPEQRAEQRQMFLALEALFNELQRMARGEITSEDEMLAQGAMQRGAAMQAAQPPPAREEPPEIFPG